LNVQNQDQQPHAVAVETRPSGVRTSWLDRWCAVRWRALITWIVLTGVMSLMLDFSEDWLFSQVQHAPQSILQIGALPSRLEDAWQISLEVALVTWFHPVLLRVGLFRGAYWVMVFSAVCFARVLIDENSTTILVIASFLAAALPGLALIGVRTRPWMILPAAACFFSGGFRIIRGGGTPDPFGSQCAVPGDPALRDAAHSACHSGRH
jgi:hypothetical protein